MKNKKFTNNDDYFNFLSKHIGNINVIEVKPINQNNNYKIHLIYENKEKRNGRKTRASKCI